MILDQNLTTLSVCLGKHLCQMTFTCCGEIPLHISRRHLKHSARPQLQRQIKAPSCSVAGYQHLIVVIYLPKEARHMVSALFSHQWEPLDVRCLYLHVNEMSQRWECCV